MKRILLCLGMMILTACSPSPESYAAATATVMRAQSVATQDALSAQATATAAQWHANGTATAIAWQAQATAVHWNIAVDATRTAVPYDAALVATRTDTENSKAWLGVLTGVAALGLGALILLAFRAILLREAKTIRRDKSGQLPVLIQEGAITNPARMLGSTVVAPRRDPLGQLARVVEWMRTGTLPQLPAPQIVETDHGASPDHLLEVARAELTATGVAAMFQPGVAPNDRHERIRLVQEASGVAPQPAPSHRTQIVANGADAVRIIMGMIRPQLPASTPPALPDCKVIEEPLANPVVPAPAPTEHEATDDAN